MVLGLPRKKEKGGRKNLETLLLYHRLISFRKEPPRRRGGGKKKKGGKKIARARLPERVVSASKAFFGEDATTADGRREEKKKKVGGGRGTPTRAAGPLSPLRLPPQRRKNDSVLSHRESSKKRGKGGRGGSGKVAVLSFTWRLPRRNAAPLRSRQREEGQEGEIPVTSPASFAQDTLGCVGRERGGRRSVVKKAKREGEERKFPHLPRNASEQGRRSEE